MKYLVAIAALVGCDNVFNLAVVEEPAGDLDGGLVGERPGFCAIAEVFDTFDGSTLCVFGAPFEESLLAQHDGVLEISVTGSDSVYAGCTAYRGYPFSDAGVFLRVTQPMRIANGITQLTVRNTFDTSPDFTARILLEDRLQFLVNDQTIAERSDSFEWWRVRQLAGTSNIAAELSHDGVVWQRWATATAALPPSVAVDLAAGLNAPSTPGKATFSAFGICQ